MRGSWLIACLLALPACAGGAARPGTPDWRGPAVHARGTQAGDLRIEMVVPTAGHSLTLASVTPNGRSADVLLRYAEPTGDFVAQVVTTLSVDVPASALADARAVAIRVQRGDDEPQLAVAIARTAR